VMPDAADRLWRGLGYAAGLPTSPGETPGAWRDALDWLPSGQAAPLAEPLLPGLAEYLERPV